MGTDEATKAFKSNLFDVLDEFFEGPPPGATGTIALDRSGSFRQSLADLSATDASREAFPGATTVAAQVIHTTYYLTNLLRYLDPQGDKASRADWAGSWARETVADTEWDAVRADLFRAYRDVRAAIDAITDWSGDRFGEAIAPLAHSAYHLGAVRQLLKALRGSNAG
ncbi:MAG: hypothetical protein WC972_04075 [Trueperaceae bacterium]|nr:hypothetical protein [Trueperaceae bacterium]HRQ10927.1 hypothetical protein [Trueperaceae bacterium]